MNPTFKITMESGGVIEGELYPDKAPQSVRNFIDLCDHHFYDGLIFHRVIPGFMIQGGCPEGTGMGGPGYCIKGEFFFNGVKNDLKHKRGVLSMARSSSPNSAGSQFFIMHADAKHLDGQYAAFGKVTSGMDVVDAIASVQTDRNDRPQVEQKIDPSPWTPTARPTRSQTSSPILTEDSKSAIGCKIPMVFCSFPWGRTGFDGGSEAGIAGRGAWPR